jgi:serine/threonine protein kinase
MTNFSAPSSVVTGVFGFNPKMCTKRTPTAYKTEMGTVIDPKRMLSLEWGGFRFLSFVQFVQTLRSFDLYKLGAGLLRDLVMQLAHGIAHLHRKGKIHGDLNPSNVFVCIGEWGICLKLGVPVRVPVRVTGTIDYYKSPEQMEHRVRNNATTRIPSQADDMWAMGLIVWFLLSGGIDVYTPVYSITRNASLMAVMHHTLLLFYGAIHDLHSMQYLQTHTCLSVSRESLSIPPNQQHIKASNAFFSFLSSTHQRFPLGSTEDCTYKLMTDLIQGSLKCDPLCRVNAEYVLKSLVTSNSHLNDIESNNGYFRLPHDLME